MKHSVIARSLAALGIAASAFAAASVAHARTEVYLQVGPPVGYAQPVYVQPAPVYVRPAPVYVQPQYGYVAPARHGYHRHGGRGHYGPWGDADRDGIRNQYDRDRDGDGVRNYRDRSPDNPWRH